MLLFSAFCAAYLIFYSRSRLSCTCVAVQGVEEIMDLVSEPPPLKDRQPRWRMHLRERVSLLFLVFFPTSAASSSSSLSGLWHVSALGRYWGRTSRNPP